MELVEEFSYTASLNPPVMVGNGPYGIRAFYEVTGGKVTGGRLHGRILSGGGDWILLGPDGFGRVDVRGQIETDDGAFLYVTYSGILAFNDKVQAAVAANKPTDWEDQYFKTTPRLETGDERYAWVNQAVFVAEGRLLPGPAVEYRVFRLA